MAGACLISAWLASCQTASEKSQPPAGRFVVTADKTLFYHLGPAQANGPDLQLSKGQQLTVVQHEFGFSRVVLDDGQTGYVPNEDISPVRVEAASVKPAATSKKSRRTPRESSEPPRESSELPLPLPENRTPSFRY